MILDFEKFLYEKREGTPLGNDNWDKAFKSLWLVKSFKKLGFKARMNALAKEYSYLYQIAGDGYDKGFLPKLKNVIDKIQDKENDAIKETEDFTEHKLSIAAFNILYEEVALNKSIRSELDKTDSPEKVLKWYNNNKASIYSHKNADMVVNEEVNNFYDFINEKNGSSKDSDDEEEDKSTNKESNKDEEKKEDLDKKSINKYITKLNKLKEKYIEDNKLFNANKKDDKKDNDDEEAENINEATTSDSDEEDSNNNGSDTSNDEEVKNSSWEIFAGIEKFVSQRDSIIRDIWKIVQKSKFKSVNRVNPKERMKEIDTLVEALIAELCEAGSEETANAADWSTAMFKKLAPGLTKKWAKNNTHERLTAEWNSAKVKGVEWQANISDLGKDNASDIETKKGIITATQFAKVPTTSEIFKDIYRVIFNKKLRIEKSELPNEIYLRSFTENNTDANKEHWYYRLTGGDKQAIYFYIKDKKLKYVIFDGKLYQYDNELKAVNTFNKDFAGGLTIDISIVGNKKNYQSKSSDIILNNSDGFKNWKTVNEIITRKAQTN